MAIDISLIQKLREETGAGIADVKAALESAEGDEAKALEFLREKGAKAAAKRADRVTNEGIVYAYIHSTQKLGVLVSLGCETDFVARNDKFKELAHDIALHIAAMQPKYLKTEDVPADETEEKALLDQEFIKDDTITIRQLLETKTGVIGEKIEIMNFTVQKIGA
jgi:elongation factor Ts